MSQSTCRRCISSLSLAIECQICRDTCYDHVRYTRVKNESWENEHCGHRFCRKCLYEYIEHKLRDGVWNIRCPSDGCRYYLVEADLKRIFQSAPFQVCEADSSSQELEAAAKVVKGKELFEAYCTLRSADYSAHLQEVMRMQSNSTTSLALADPEGRVLMPSFGAWALDACQACPRCYIIVRKEMGCDHISCRCGEDFRFCCGGPFSQTCVCNTPDAKKLPRLGRWMLAKKSLPWSSIEGDILSISA